MREAELGEIEGRLVADATGYRRWNLWAEASLFLALAPIAAAIAAGYDLVIGRPEMEIALLIGPPLAIFTGWIARKRTRNGPPEAKLVANLGFGLGFLGMFGCCGLPFREERESSRRYQSVNNLKQIGMALHNYHEAFGRFPPAVIRDREGRPLYSWRVAILPFAEASEVHREYHLDEPWDSPHNLALLPKMPSFYASPGQPRSARLGETPYQAVVGPGMAFENPEGATLGPPGKRPFAEDFQRRGSTFVKANMSMGDFPDGTDQTLMVVATRRSVPWSKPEDLAISAGAPIPLLGEEGLQGRGAFAKPTVSGFNALFVDGSVRFLKRTTPEAILRALFSRAGGETITQDQF